MPSHPQQKLFVALSSAANTPEEFGVLFTKTILRSASDNKITSADSKSLLVPFAVTVTPASSQGFGKTESIECYTSCWKVLGQPVFCVTKCLKIQNPELPHRAHADDQTLKGLVRPGPPLPKPEAVEKSLATSLLRVSSPMEAGIILMNSVLVILSQRADLVGADGSAELTGVVKVSFSAGAHSNGGLTYQCVETCYSVLGHEILCYEQCHAKVE